MGFFDFVGEGAKWVGDRLGDADNWVNQRLNDAGGWFSDLYHGNLGEQAVPAPVIVQQVQQGPGTTSWDTGSATVQKIAQQHNQNSDDVQQISTALESVWTGGGADAAQSRIRPLSEASTTAAQAYSVNGQKLVDTTHGYNEMKTAMQPMPATPPHRNLYDESVPWTTDTEQKIKDYNAVAQQNVDRYNVYAQQAQSNGQGLNSNYGQVSGLGNGDITIGSGQPGTGTQQSTVSHNTSRGSQSGDSGRQTATGDPSSTFSPTQPGGTAPVGSGGGATAPPSHQPGSGPGDGTTTSGWTPPSVNPVGGPGSGPGWVPPSSQPVGGGTGGGSGWSPGMVGGFGPNGGLAGGEPGGASGGSGAGTGGRGSGAGRLGAGPGAGAGEEAVGRGQTGAAARGAAGARGSSGMGGMGAAGKGGKGEEDKEHQRKYGLDDDSAFDVTDDEDGRLRDPRTGMPPAPPTIGG
ncbi:hypothetical protein [Amycolatopsis sp. NBC_01480]|uniref:hypothetical protein n=1 Tax=Amycolatopsis sp. NBC_01480 TaxID=2903562 RepID=UPI002E2C41B5|nr:hypothetical protein [Amycolatopsis sp. NBC_01480]